MEAGPDYGPCDDGRWPAELVDAGVLPATHQWGYDSGTTLGERVLPFPRGRVLGGCSAINHCGIARGSSLDYDGWAAAGCAGWATRDLLPFFDEASRRLRVHRYTPDEITPFHRAVFESARNVGLPEAEIEDLDAREGVGYFAANVDDGKRVNAAFAYVDDVRSLPNLTIAGGVAVDRVIVERGRADGVLLASGRRIIGGRVVICGGAYASPAILLRSGIGAGRSHPLEGVGRNLQDHATVRLRFAGGERLARETNRYLRDRPMPLGQSIVLARSTLADAVFDLHLFPHEQAVAGGGFGVVVPVAVMTPRARGSIGVSDAAPASPPSIDHAYLADEADVTTIVNGIELARRLMAAPPVAELAGRELEPGAHVQGRDLRAWARKAVASYYHPVGTCAMGSAADESAVVDADGFVHGLEGLAVVDASVMPSIPRANTNLPTAVVAENFAHRLLEGAR